MIENKLCERYNKIIESALENVDCEEGGDTLKKIKLGAVLMAALMMLSILLTACSGGASSSTPVSEPASTASSSGSTSAAEPTENDWMTPFEETVTLDVVVGWDANATVKEGTR